ncbi:ABC transporter substrate-binding protein [Actinomadura sp. SCN-SB]|uniref:ABC transporter substrate-binding protein n=1 Tax=Actinomadura sp. SCN-SB TaxID=3373092 RepID=UPI0037519BE6
MKALRITPLIVAMAGALALTGCAAEEGGRPSGDPNAAGPPQAGGTMRLATYSEPRMLDPALMINQYSNHALFGNALFGTLVTPGQKEGTVRPGLAESFATTDKGTTWTVKLRDGLTFSDGTPLDAKAVEDNWRRTADQKLGSESRPAAALVEEYEAKGQTLTVKLGSPYNTFPDAVMATSLNWIASPKALATGSKFNDNPVGAGPFVLEKWTRGGEMRLKKNPSYYAEGRPYLDALVLKPVQDEDQRFNNVLTNGADAAVTATPQLLDRARSAGLPIYEFPTSGGIKANFNARIAPFNDPRARMAVVKALDMNAINQATYAGKAEVPQSLFAKDSPYFKADLPSAKQDKATAQKLFDQLAAEGKPVKFKITSFPSASGLKAVQSIQAQLKTYRNVTAEVEVLDYPAALAKQLDHTFQMIPGGIMFREPAFALYFELHSKSSGNISGIADPELDKALETGRSSADPAERSAAFATVSRKFAELNPLLLYVRANPTVIASKKAHGFEMYNRGSLLVDGMWLSR